MCRKITVYTQAYNAEKYLGKCLDSVVNQTYPIYQYILVNDNSSDNTQAIMEEYASKYDFITLQSYDTNKLARYTDIIPQYATGEFVAIIDADDWWEIDYLEKLVAFLEKHELDLALTGTVGFNEKEQVDFFGRQLEKPLVLTQKQFAENYEAFWVYPSTVWGSIFKLELYKKIDFTQLLSKITRYGFDTVLMLEYIKQCDRIGIDNTALYHYRIYPASVSYKYYETRFLDNISYYECIKAFLEANDVLNEQKIRSLKDIHLGSLYVTMETLANSDLPSYKKFEEVLRILSHDLTCYVYKKEGDNKERLKFFVRQIIGDSISEIIGTEYEPTVVEVINLFAPICSNVFKFELIPLFFEQPLIWNAFIRDNKEELLELVLQYADTKANAEYDCFLPDIIKKLIPKNTPISDVNDEKFFNLYPGICKLVLDLENSEALSEMTEILLSGNELNCPEDFLNLYVTLAALENHAEAFIFGNIQKVYLFIDEKRYAEAREIVNDLVEMGVGDSEDVIALISELETK